MIYGEKTINTPIRWAMIGGGRGSQIGYIHRSAALRDFHFTLVAGVFETHEETNKMFGSQLNIAVERCYPDYETMFIEEAKRKDGIEAVSIATPNFLHYEIAKKALEAGLHVICEKPLSFTKEEAVMLQRLATEKNLVLAVTYGYAGYQMIEQARQLIIQGELGDIRIVKMQFAHGFHSEAVEQHDPSIQWRVDPKRVGPSYVLGDLATHTLYLAEMMVPQLKIKRLLCSKQSFVPTRAPLEDNAFVLMECERDIMATFWASCINTGSTHQQIIRIIGTKASLEWHDEFPNQLRLERQDAPVQLLDRGMGYLNEAARKDDRIAAGHPEGIFESWSNLYSRFAKAIDIKRTGQKMDKDFWYPDVEAGVSGVRFIENCLASANDGAVWVTYK